MTEKTKAIEQKMTSSDTEESFTESKNNYKFLTKKLYSANDDEFEVNQTFEIEPDRFAEHNESTRLSKEAKKISKELARISAAIANIKKQIIEAICEDDRCEIYASKDSVKISSDVSISISMRKELNLEHHRLDSQMKGLLYEKIRIDDRLRGKVIAAQEVFMALLDGRKVYDSKGRALSCHQIEYWLRMHGRLD